MKSNKIISLDQICVLFFIMHLGQLINLLLFESLSKKPYIITLIKAHYTLRSM